MFKWSQLYFNVHLALIMPILCLFFSLCEGVGISKADGE